MLNLVANGPSGYNLTNSLRFRSSASAKLSRTPTLASNRTTWTWSGWVKRGALSSLQVLWGASIPSNPAGLTMLQFQADDTVRFYLDDGSTSYGFITTQVFRDPSAWYHFALAFDTTQATAANRIKFYVNGTQVTAFSSSSYPSQNSAFSQVNNTQLHNFGVYPYDGSRPFDGYMTDINFIDGQALTPSSFGSTNATTGVWQPAKYTGTYGTNGFYLNFNSIALTSGSNTGLGKDNSGNGNYWNTNNISVTSGTTYDAMTDVPTLTSTTTANYAVLNPLGYTGVFTFADGNLKVTGTSGGNNVQAQGTIFVNSGKWYWEITDLNGGAGSCIGISDVSVSTTTAVGTSALSYGYLANSGNKINNGSSVAYGATFGANDVIGVALDLTAGTLVFYKNGVSQGTAYSSLTGTFSAAVGDNSGASTPAYTANFGQRPFSYTPPTGYVALNTYNLPTPTILQGNKYMDATTFTGNATTQVIVNQGQIKPDLVWLKSRTNANNHTIYDSIRGADNILYPNLTNAAVAGSGNLTAFNSNGFTLGASENSNDSSGESSVGWQWQAGQGSTSSNTSGSITSTVSVNTTAGFSIVTYTGSGSSSGTFGHGLGVAPAMFIIKSRSQTGENWVTWHKSFSNTAQGNMSLNTTGAVSNSASVWGNTAPTSTLITVGNSAVNNNTSTYVAYCWADVSGFSKAFSYTGNGSTDGSFVYVGFLPRFVMIKRTDTTGDWYMWDTARNTYDVITNTLLANSSAAETSATSIDALSNGFKLRNTTAGFNANGGTYIGMAWASSPFKNSNAF